jgi:hypothetical protein
MTDEIIVSFNREELPDTEGTVFVAVWPADPRYGILGRRFRGKLYPSKMLDGSKINQNVDDVTRELGGVEIITGDEAEAVVSAFVIHARLISTVSPVGM